MASCFRPSFLVEGAAPAGAGGAAWRRARVGAEPAIGVTMRTLRRLKFMSSPSLSDLGKREPAAAAAEERGTQQRRACANATWNR